MPLVSSIPIPFAPAKFRTFATTKGSSGGIAKEPGLLDIILGGMQKEQFFETDPILKKVEETKSGGGTTSGRNSVSVPKKKGGFGGLFAKN